MDNVETKETPLDDPTLLLVSGSKGDKQYDKEYVKKLGNAIIQVYTKHGRAKLRCVGAAAINNGIKAFIIAKAEAVKKEIKLQMDPSFTTVVFQGQEKTGILMDIQS